MTIKTIAILHPGEMGATVGAAVSGPGRRVIWCSEGRSSRTAARAQAFGLEDVGSLSTAVKEADLVLSVCPPQFADDVADEVVALGYIGLYADLNAIAPPKAEGIARRIEAAGATYIDGGIVGSPMRTKEGRPVRTGGNTRVYLSGPAASEIRPVFDSSVMEPVVMEGVVTVASALKMAYASYSKVHAALIAAVVAVATRTGVGDALKEEWAKGNPGLYDRALSGLRNNAPKAWRFVPEMEEIAATYAAAGLPTGFQDAAAELYRRLEDHKEENNPPSGEALIEELLRVKV